MSDKATSAASYTAGGISTTFGALTLNEIALTVGIVLSIGTFLVNWYYKHQTLKIHKDKNE